MLHVPIIHEGWRAAFFLSSDSPRLAMSPIRFGNSKSCCG